MAGQIPRMTVCGLRGGSGKTLVALGLACVLRERGHRVLPFKKGPDYIDAAWHTLAAEAPCRNLDTFMMSPEVVLRSFLRHSDPGAVSLIEGNRGLYDGMDSEGTHSSAELAKLLASPVLLAVDCTKATRTVAAMVAGCKYFDEDVHISGVVLNRIGSARQEKVIRKAIAESTGVPVMGAVPRIRGLQFLERPLGLLPPPEHPDAQGAVQMAWEAVAKYVDVDAVLEAAHEADPLETPAEAIEEISFSTGARLRVGVIRDGAFNFYYPENLEELEESGAELVELNALNDRELPPLDALYIGGGFPETHAEALTANECFRRSVRKGIEDGLPVYAECGGLTYLSESITMGGSVYPMVGAFPVAFEVAPKPQGHGYAVLRVDRPNPFFTIGTILRGHEFRYSRALDSSPGALQTVCEVERGTGFDGTRGGLCYKNTFATFCHVHALGTRDWAQALLGRARQYREAKMVEDGQVTCSAPNGANFLDDRALANTCDVNAKRLVG